MEFIVEFLLSIIWEFVLQVVFEIVFEGIAWLLAEPFRARTRKHPVLAGLALVVSGASAGGISYAMLPHRVFGVTGVPGVSLILAPLANGLAMEIFGEWWASKGRPKLYITTFWGGALFAFSMAAVRFGAIQS